MIIFPELQIAEGRVVTRASRAAENVVHAVAPLDAIARLEDQGAERLHILDVDAALGREHSNADLLLEIISRTDIPVQVAGGMRTAHQIETWLEAGAASVVLGTVAITDPSLLAEACARHPGAVLANVATQDGYVMIDGWQTQTAYRPEDIVYDLQMAGVAGIVHFDIDRLIGDGATSLALTMEMKQHTVIPVYSSGTVHTLDDLARICYLPDIHGVIIGRALLDGTFSLRDALDVAQQSERRIGAEAQTSVTLRGIQRPQKIYLAAYNLSLPARWWNQDLRTCISDENPYVDLVIPHEDLEIDRERMSKREIQAAYEQVVDEADAVVVLLDGIEDEAWTAFECGYARARGKFLIGVAAALDNESRSRFEAMCDDIVRFDPDEDRRAVLSLIAREISARLMSEEV